MKINTTLTALSFLFAALIAYAFYINGGDGTNMSKILACSSGVSVFITTMMLTSVYVSNSRRVANQRVVSFLFLVCFIIEHVLLIDCARISEVFIATGLFLVIYFFLIYNIHNIKM